MAQKIVINFHIWDKSALRLNTPWENSTYNHTRSLLFRPNMKLAKIQCKSLINRNLSSQATLDGHCFHGKVSSWCKHTRKSLEGSEACLRVSPTLWVKLSSVVARLDAKTGGTWWNMRACLYNNCDSEDFPTGRVYMLWNPNNHSVPYVQMHSKQPLRSPPFGKNHNQNHTLSRKLGLASRATRTD